MQTNKKGFSLIELLIVISIFMILFLAAAPSMHDTINKNKSSACANRLISALQFSRASSIKFGGPVIFCKSRSGKSCGGSWSDGQIVITKTGELLRALPPLPLGDNLILYSRFGEQDSVTFLPGGFPNGQQGSFYYQTKGTLEKIKIVTLNQNGRARTIKST